MKNRLLGVIVPFAVACLLSGCGDSKKREEGRAQLTRRAAEQLQAAAAKASAFDFDGANAILGDLRNEVNQSPFADVATYEKLMADIEAAYRSVSEQESEYRKKTREGWKVITGKLVSPDDQARALAEQKRREEDEAKRREEERRTVEARARAEADARGEEARRREQAALKAKLDTVLSAHDMGFGTIERVGSGELLVAWKFSTVYVAANASDIMSNHPSYGVFFFTAYREPAGEFTEPAAGFFRVDGKPQRVGFHSEDEKVVHVYEDGSAGFPGGGKTNVVVSLAGESVKVPVTVVQLPVNSGRYLTGSPAEDVIRLMGLPDEKQKHYVSWPDSEIIDGIYYGSSDPRWGIATEHWKYRKYPGAVIAIVANRVYAVGTYAPEKVLSGQRP
jgi:hypothetical protein